jgi:uncharacterized protein YndB with AHSA1/START domain
MQVTNKADFSLDDATCKAETGKTFSEWFEVLDSVDGIKIGRRESCVKMGIWSTQPWWATTIYVAYEKHKGVVKKDGMAEGYTICVTKNINAPVEKTYATWADPAKFAEIFGDSAKQSLEEGGTLTCDAGVKATFTRVRPNKDLRFTWEHPGCTAPLTVDLQFQDNKGKTLMNAMTSRIQTREETDGLRDAWTAVLNKLKAAAEA